MSVIRWEGCRLFVQGPRTQVPSRAGGTLSHTYSLADLCNETMKGPEQALNRPVQGPAWAHDRAPTSLGRPAPLSRSVVKEALPELSSHQWVLLSSTRPLFPARDRIPQLSYFRRCLC